VEIDEIKKIKTETELAILLLLRNFTDRTNLSVSNINFEYATELGKRYMAGPVSVVLTVYI
jgi:hypothetical protein